MRIYKLTAAVFAMFLLQSCSEDNPNAGKPIVLGDPSTIVTETDSTYLQDFVADPQPAPRAEQPAAIDTPEQKVNAAQQPEEPKEQKKEEAEEKAPQGKGLNMAFKETTIFIPNIVTRTYKQQDLQKANGATYELSSGNLSGNQIKVSKGTVSKISQRYQTVIIAKNELGTLALESLSKTSDWQNLKGSNGNYTISGLDERRLEYIKASPNAIKNAVSRAARNGRMNKKTEQKWVNSIRNVKAVNQKPLAVELRSVMWKVEGKDAQGKSFQKQIRMDLPL